MGNEGTGKRKNGERRNEATREWRNVNVEMGKRRNGEWLEERDKGGIKERGMTEHGNEGNGGNGEFGKGGMGASEETGKGGMGGMSIKSLYTLCTTVYNTYTCLLMYNVHVHDVCTTHSVQQYTIHTQVC